MVTTNINAVLTLMQQKQIQFFKIFDVTGKNLAYIQDEEETTPAEAYQELSDYLKNLEAGIVTIQLSEKSFKDKQTGGNVKTGNYLFKVRIGNNLHTPVISGMNEDYKDLLKQNYELQNKIMILEHERKTDEVTRKLEEKIEGLKSEDVLEKYLPLLSGLFNKFMTPTQPQQTAQPVINGLENTDDKKTVITQAINRLLKVDKDLAENLTLLANFAESNPEKYKSFIPMLKIM